MVESIRIEKYLYLYNNNEYYCYVKHITEMILNYHASIRQKQWKRFPKLQTYLKFAYDELFF